jgi:hypothetical protein
MPTVLADIALKTRIVNSLRLRRLTLVICISALGASALAATVSNDQPAVGESIRHCAECPELVVVPAGSFIMGSDHLEPVAGELRPANHLALGR